MRNSLTILAATPATRNARRIAAAFSGIARVDAAPVHGTSSKNRNGENAVFDTDKITSIVILVTNNSEIFAYKGELVGNNLVNVISGPKEIQPSAYLVEILHSRYK
jgi:hypothetical protein